MYQKLKKDLAKMADLERADNLQRFFKTGKGQYGEGDIFLGLKANQIMFLVKDNYRKTDILTITKLLNSKIHEERMLAIKILVLKYQKGNHKEKKEIYNFYINHSSKINNWDLVDVSAPKIVGDYLLSKNKNILFVMAKSSNLWKRRISIISSMAFIKKGCFKDIFKIIQILLKDEHDLIHKAMGWVLREIIKKDYKKGEMFLMNNYGQIPRTTLRYAIEKMPNRKRKQYLYGQF